MSDNIDPKFYDRADGHIQLANQHVKEVGRGKVSASFLYGCARFQAWNAACWAGSAEDMKSQRDATVEYFVRQYQAMLEENLDDYIAHYSEYMQPDDES